MISLSRAASTEDFIIIAGFCEALGALDVELGRDHGIPAETVMALFHGETHESLARKYDSDDAMMFLARWEGAPAGCIALAPFEGDAMEIHKFYVDPTFRGRGIGNLLMQRVFDEAKRSRRSTMLVNTAAYLKSAVSLYEAFGFVHCPPFHEVPAEISHTEVFMSRPL
ncbi:GNAT superfamily N-acetyltransferase [Rhizobium sp. BK650]|uniref:GNAT family N-acetyltransferase n=1 Tax=Rhizobium sp. BK650 TaxID=2586990 RepID=UPI00160EE5D2|nr:GNAT family N-acetyltransferase [Rhizobium sp. BK650]MBB3659636.1 GNAT superfamily N-acetyltransferase [Rhizobium sp. BK650]